MSTDEDVKDIIFRGFLALQKMKGVPINVKHRMLGNLIAMNKDPETIIETDDDNIPLKDFFSKKKIIKQKTYISKNAGWVNVYKFFTKKHIWPRGFALEELNKPLSTEP